MNTLKLLTLLLCTLSMTTACVTTPSKETDLMAGPEKVESRASKRLLAIGGILLLGAIVAHEAQDGAQDALRSTGASR